MKIVINKKGTSQEEEEHRHKVSADGTEKVLQ